MGTRGRRGVREHAAASGRPECGHGHVPKPESDGVCVCENEGPWKSGCGGSCDSRKDSSYLWGQPDQPATSARAPVRVGDSASPRCQPLSRRPVRPAVSRPPAQGLPAATPVAHPVRGSGASRGVPRTRLLAAHEGKRISRWSPWREFAVSFSNATYLFKTSNFADENLVTELRPAGPPGPRLWWFWE